MKRMQPKRESPLSILGEHLKHLRERRKESLAEVSGAVEIDIETLERIEDGAERPSEDVLSLLINYFALHEHEAGKLWELAGFDAGDRGDRAGEATMKPTLVVVALDVRVLYSDDVTVTGSKNGLVMNFSQSGPMPGPQLPVARIGMSYEQAEEVIGVLQRALLERRYGSGRKLLPPGNK